MKVTYKGVTYEGTVDEIREILADPPRLVEPERIQPSWWDCDFKRNWDGSPAVMCSAVPLLLS